VVQVGKTDTELTEGAVDGTVRRTVHVNGSLSKEDNRSKSSHKAVKLAVVINFLLRASERLDFKFSVLTRVAICNSCFPPFLTARMIRPSGFFPPSTSCVMGI
jgi:hypothetical protein